MDESSATTTLQAPPGGTYGFIGLGNMGYGMAKNVREKMPSASKLIVCELNAEQRDKFVQEYKDVGAGVQAVESPKQVAEACVCPAHPFHRPHGRVTVLIEYQGRNHLLAPQRHSSAESVPRAIHRRARRLLPGIAQTAPRDVNHRSGRLTRRARRGAEESLRPRIPRRARQRGHPARLGGHTLLHGRGPEGGV